MQKTVLIIHGWPQPIGEDHRIHRYFREKGFWVCCPYLFKMEGEFSSDGVKKMLIGALEGKSPDVIVGVSIGGLLVPSVALDYPRAKLVFVSSGTRFSPKNWFVKYGPRLCRIGMIKLVKSLDEKLLLRVYRLINPNRIKTKDECQSDGELLSNMERVLELPDDRIREITDFISKTNNRKLLTKIENRAVIFSGDSDSIMPYRQGKKMNRLIKNSRFFVLKGKHHDLINNELLKILDDFLEDSLS